MPFNRVGGTMYRADWILSWIFLSSHRSSSTGTLDGDPIYYQELKLILSSDLRGVRDRVATTQGASLGFRVEIPPLLIVFFGSTGGRRSLLLGFGLHFTVSRSLLPSLLSLCWLIKQAIVGVEYYIQ